MCLNIQDFQLIWRNINHINVQTFLLPRLIKSFVLVDPKKYDILDRVNLKTLHARIITN